MRKYITVFKPFKFVDADKNPQEGFMAPNYLVVLCRRTYEVVSIARLKEQFPLKYEYRLLVDLWFIKARFEWIGKRNAKAQELWERQESERMVAGKTTEASLRDR